MKARRPKSVDIYSTWRSCWVLLLWCLSHRSDVLPSNRKNTTLPATPQNE